jgi:hypothetical protein
MAGLMWLGDALSVKRDLYPNIADTSHATHLAADFFHGYFTAKSLHNATQ